MSGTVQSVIDVRHLLKTLSVEQLNHTADEYFAKFDNPVTVGRLLAKPFISLRDAPGLLISFANVLQGLHLSAHQTILDFGAGPGWATRYFTQMGLKAIACDVSMRALNIAKKGFEIFPIQGPHHKPQFLHFDSHKLDLPDESVDRIYCQDAFHHVPNQGEVLNELARVLKPGGIAGFSEPGPNHSRSEQSQLEMRQHTVIENDIILEEIWPLAQKAGFSDIRVGYFTPILTLMTMQEYNDHVYENAPLPAHCSLPLQAILRERRLFFLYRFHRGAPSYRQGSGLRAELRVELPTTPIRAHEPFDVTVHVRNTGEAAWLQQNISPIGAYKIGVRFPKRLLSRAKRDFTRIPLPPTMKCAYLPGDEITVSATLPGLPRGRHRLLFDMVSEAVCWFEDRGSKATSVTVEVH